MLNLNFLDSFHKNVQISNPSSDSRVVPRGCTDRHKKKKLTVAFRNYTKALKKKEKIKGKTGVTEEETCVLKLQAVLKCTLVKTGLQFTETCGGNTIPLFGQINLIGTGNEQRQFM